MKVADDIGEDNQGPTDSLQSQTVLSHLAYVVSKQRQTLGLTVEEMAARTNISVSDLNAFESGDWDIDLVSLDSIAACLKVKLKVVFISTEALAAKSRKKRD